MRTTLKGLVLLLAAVFILGGMSQGCITSKSAATGEGAKVRDEGPVPVYYDFDDVLVPSELKIDKKASFVYATPNFASGVLVMDGYVDADSLVAFFKENMAKDGWFLRSSFRYRRTILVYQKGNRDCLITIVDELTRTHVEIWVAQNVVGVEGGPPAGG
jgi:hypothetical protein